MKKIGVLISVILVLSILVPVLAYAGKPVKEPRTLEKKVFIHYKKGYGKPDWVADKKPPKDDGHDSHYALLGKGVVWKDDMPLHVQVNPTNDDGLGYAFMEGAVDAALAEWDGYTSTYLFADAVVNYSATFDYDSTDGFNEIVFGDYAEANVIAICYTWGYFGGKPSTREIVEFDIMLDTDYEWGNGEANSLLMDVQNIVTHEVGHGIGLADIYDCDLETMYGYSDYGDIVKRDLYYGDIAGLQKLYGP
jgi:hypothetical protein